MRENLLGAQYLLLIIKKYILHCRLHFHPQDTLSCFSFSLRPNTNGYQARCYLMRHSYSTLMAITNWRNLKRLTLAGLYKKCIIKNVLASICFNKAFRFLKYYFSFFHFSHSFTFPSPPSHYIFLFSFRSNIFMV